MIECVLAIAGAPQEERPEWDRLRSRCDADGSVTERMLQRSGLSVYVAGHQPNISTAEDGRFFVVVHGRLLASPPEQGVTTANGGPESGLMGAELLRDLWVRHGARTVELLRGAYAALVYDEATRLLSVFRDHVGQKPLFFSNEDGQLILGTEAGQVATLLRVGRRLNVPALVGHLLHRPSAHDLGSLYEGVGRVVPGQLYEASLAGAKISLRRKTFWAPERVKEVQLGTEEAAERLIDVLGAAVERCCWGSSCTVSMSGGLDSTTLWALAHRASEQSRLGAGKVACVSLVFPGLQCDESQLISQVHSRIGSTPGALCDGGSEGGFADLAADLAADLDCPQYPTDFFMVPISGAARDLGAATLVTGLMADQIFYRALEFLVEDVARGRFRSFRSGLPWLSRYPWKTRADILVKALRAAIGVSLRRLGLRRQRGRVGERPWWLNPDAWRAFAHEDRPGTCDDRQGPETERALVRSVRTMQVPGEVLHRQEMLTRRRGLLLGTPFLDRDVMELALSLPNHVMQSGGWPKGLLRRAAATLLPSDVVWREGRTSFDTLFTVDEITRAAGPPADRWRLCEVGLLGVGALDNIVARAHTQWDYRSLLARLASAELFIRRF